MGLHNISKTVSVLQMSRKKIKKPAVPKSKTQLYQIEKPRKGSQVNQEIWNVSWPFKEITEFEKLTLARP